LKWENIKTELQYVAEHHSKPRVVRTAQRFLNAEHDMNIGMPRARRLSLAFLNRHLPNTEARINIDQAPVIAPSYPRIPAV